MAARILDWKTDVITTTDATPTIATGCAITMSVGWTMAVHVRLAITKPSTGATTVGEWHAGYSCPTNATAAASGVTNWTLQDEIGLSGSCFSFSTSGRIVQPRFTGLAATNLTTRFSVEYRIN